MNELIKYSIDIHIFFVFFILSLSVINLYVVKKCDEYIKMTKKYELFSPLYYLGLSAVIFTGSVVLAVFKFDIKPIVYLMILVSLVIIVGAFKTHKLFKKTRVRDMESQVRFREFAVKKFGIDTLLILFTTILAFVVRS